MTVHKKYNVEITDSGWDRFPKATDKARLTNCTLMVEGMYKNKKLTLHAPDEKKISFDINHNIVTFLEDWNIINRRVLIEKAGHIL